MNHDMLQHHGIKGQKWGVRRFQNEDGTLTPEGRKRYGVGEKKIAKYQDEYAQKGMTSEESRRAAEKRAKIERGLAIALGVTIAAAATYASVKIGREYIDKELKIGDTLKRVSVSSVEDGKRAFYAAYKTSDANRYIGLYGEQLQDGHAGMPIYQHEFVVANKSLKIASPHSAEKVFKEFVSDDNKNVSSIQSAIRRMYTAMLANGGGANDKQYKTLKNALNDLQSGKTTSRSVFEAFNMTLANHTNNDFNLVKEKYYSKLKEKGFGGLADINDRLKSGYNTKSATIVFGNLSNVQVKSKRVLDAAEIGKKYMKSILQIFAPMLAKGMLPGVAIGAAGVAVRKGSEYAARRSQFVSQYRSEHPNTKLTDNEIALLM